MIFWTPVIRLTASPTELQLRWKIIFPLTTYQDPTKLPSVVVSLDWTGLKSPAYLDLKGDLA